MERTRGRSIRRSVTVYEPPADVPSGWPPIGRLVQVVRSGERAGRLYHQEGFYLTSRQDGAAALAEAIRLHWHIENRLHWSKDVEMGEDGSRLRSLRGAQVLSLLRGIAVSLAHHAGVRSMTAARSRWSNRVGALLDVLRT